MPTRPLSIWFLQFTWPELPFWGKEGIIHWPCFRDGPVKVWSPASQDWSSDPNLVACSRHLSYSALSTSSFCFLISCGHGAPSEGLPGTAFPTCCGLGWSMGHTELNQSRHREVTCKEKAVLRWIIQILQATISIKAKKTPNTPGEYLTWWLLAMSRTSQQTGKRD